MTPEEKAKAYDEALEKAKMSYHTGDYDRDTLEMLEIIFPELCESDDEKIRKHLISLVKNWDKDGIASKYTSDVNDIKQILAWLEKQGENANFYNKIQVGDKVTRNKDGVLVNLSQLKRVAIPIENQSEQKPYGQRQECADCQFNYAGECKGSCAMKREEQKHIDKIEPKDYNSIDPHFFKTADKVEPKFHEGNWLVNNNSGDVYQVTRIRDNEYCLWPLDSKIEGYLRIIDVDNDYHLWTIQDAKDGDVLCVKYGNDEMPFIFNGKQDKVAYCALNSFGEFVLSIAEWLLKTSVLPATKEQRDTLFAKMKEAGWEFDFEKKELKKIDTPIFKIGDTIAKKHNSDIHDFGSFTITDIAGEKYWYNDRIICDITKQDEWELYEPVRQTPAEWSEEDEKTLKGIIDFIKNPTLMYPSKKREYIDYLKKQISSNKKVDELFDHRYCKYIVESEKETKLAGIQWKGNNLKEVIEFTGKDKNFDKWFNSFEDYEKYVREHNNIFKIFRENGDHLEVPVGAWIIKTPDGYNVPSMFDYKQKLIEWSEEDEQIILSIEQVMNCASLLNIVPEKIDKIRTWLKSLRPQPKQKWSKEDNYYRNCIIQIIEEIKNAPLKRNEDWDTYINWLKSLKPQNRWKLSDEQIGVIEAIINNRSFQRRHLNSLYEQLKKLREE